MISHRQSKWAVCAMAAGAIALLSVASHAGRSVRADSSDNGFDFSGEFWGNDQPFDPAGATTFAAGKTAFKLKLSPKHPARYYNVCMGEGFIKLIAASATCADADFAGPPTPNYIAAYAADFADGAGFGGAVSGRGFIDTTAPYRMGQAVPVQRYSWQAVSLASDASGTPFRVQVVLIDRSGGNNNGDFDIELNYGFDGDVDPVPPVPSSEGFQGFHLGPNQAGPDFGPFGPFTGTGAPIRFCFRGGKERACN